LSGRRVEDLELALQALDLEVVELGRDETSDEPWRKKK